jgi:hypothetical protein
MRRRLRVVLALIAIMVLAGCGGPSVEAARAAVPHAPAPHVPPRPRVHIPPWEHEPPVWRHAVPPDVASVEVLKELRIRQLERRYAQVSALVPYACKAKGLWDASQAESADEAVEKVLLDAGGDFTFLSRVVALVNDMKEQSSFNRISELAMFTFCEAYH